MNFTKEHEILLVGEGDFSFWKSVANKLGSAKKMTATGEELEETICNGTLRNLVHLASMGCRRLHGMDPTTMSSHENLRDKRFDRIVFNNPRVRTAGPDHDKLIIKENRKLMKEFFENASGLLRQGGEVYVSVKTCAPYNEWRVVRQAAKTGLFLADKFEFKKSDFPGYTSYFPLDTFVFKQLPYL